MSFTNILYAEFKRFINSIKMFLLGAIVLFFMIGTIAFCGYKFFSSENTPIQSVIGVYSEESESNTSFLFYFLDAFDSTTTYFSFQEYDVYDTAITDLEQNKLAALLVIPDEVVNGILSGSNEPIQILFQNQSELGSILLSELSKAGASILSSAQASIYAVDDISLNSELFTDLDKAFETINLDNMQVAMGRESVFREISLGTTGQIPVTLYYAASMVILFFLLSGISFSSYLAGPKLTLLRVLKHNNRSLLQIYLARILCLSGFYLILTLASVILFCDGNMGGIFSCLTAIGLCICLSLTITLQIVVFYVLSTNSSFGLMLLFFASIIFHFVAGGILPYALLPRGMRAMAPYTPNYQLHHTLMDLFNTEAPVAALTDNIGVLVALSTFYLLVIYIILKIRERRLCLC